MRRSTRQPARRSCAARGRGAGCRAADAPADVARALVRAAGTPPRPVGDLPRAHDARARHRRMAIRFRLLERRRRPASAASGAGARRLAEVAPGRAASRCASGCSGSRGRGLPRRVQYRWYDADGRVIRRARGALRRCSLAGGAAQPARPSIDVGPARSTGRYASYAVKIVNRGGGAAPGRHVALRVDGDTVDNPGVGALGAGRDAPVSSTGPLRPSRARRRRPGELIAERNERDNVLDAGCALASRSR